MTSALRPFYRRRRTRPCPATISSAASPVARSRADEEQRDSPTDCTRQPAPLLGGSYGTHCYNATPRPPEYCDDRVSLCVCVCVCVFVCLRSYPRKYTTDLHHIFVQVTYGRGSVLLWRCCDMLCTSGFVDDVISQGYSTSPHR